MELTRRNFVVGVGGAAGLLALAPLEASGWKVEQFHEGTDGFPNSWVLAHADGRRGILYEKPVGDGRSLSTTFSQHWDPQVMERPEWYLNFDRVDDEDVSKRNGPSERRLLVELAPGDHLFMIEGDFRESE